MHSAAAANALDPLQSPLMPAMRTDASGSITATSPALDRLVAGVGGRRLDEVLCGVGAGLAADASRDGSAEGTFRIGGRVWLRAALVRDEETSGLIISGLDVTESHEALVNAQSTLDSLDRSQAVIEFQLDGTIVDANANFLAAMGYERSEIVGQHHRIFVDPEYAASDDYSSFWRRLAAGEAFIGEFKRRTKTGNDIWILASYNPSRDAEGNLIKVTKFAMDVTHMVRARMAAAATANRLTGTSSELGRLSGELTDSSAKVTTEVNSSVRALERVGEMTRTLAASTEEMSASIQEIANNSHEAAGVASSAVGSADSARALIGELDASSQEIGDVVKMIQSITEQTNLLALNATIEAARAGEAGKGFAVVAGEVKSLAREASKATEGIAQRVAAIQTNSDSARIAISEIHDVVTRISDIQTTIAGAVEEQTATTREMAISVSETAQQSAEVETSVKAVAAAAHAAETSSSETRRTAEQLAALGQELNQLVSGA